VLAAALGGLAVVFWTAASWQTHDGLGGFALLEALVVAMCAAAICAARARAPRRGVLVSAAGSLRAGQAARRRGALRRVPRRRERARSSSSCALPARAVWSAAPQ